MCIVPFASKTDFIASPGLLIQLLFKQLSLQKRIKFCSFVESDYSENECWFVSRNIGSLLVGSSHHRPVTK